MIITRTPFRVSFFGGGTDYPAWYKEHGGSVLATTIDKYCYITCRKLPPFFEHKHRIVYSLIENVIENEEIKHPSVRAIFNWANISEGLEIHHDGDLPARSGLGSSSAFTVGMIHAIRGLEGRLVNKRYLAEKAIHIEQDLIGENVGSQDQVLTAHGGFRRVDFYESGGFDLTPVIFSSDKKTNLNSHLMLFFTGISRYSGDVAKTKIVGFPKKIQQMTRIQEMVDDAFALIASNGPLEEFGALLDEGWSLKRSLSNQVSTGSIDEIYREARSAGAIGGKILGAGGGGFFLLFAKPEHHQSIKKRLNKLVYVDFKFDETGSQVVLYQPNGL